MKTQNCLKVVLPLLCWLGNEVVAHASGDAWVGLAGAELKRAVERDCVPRDYVSISLTERGIWEILKSTDANVSGDAYIDRFSGMPLGFAPSVNEAPADAVPVNVIDAGWWKPESDMRFGVEHDLYNIYLSTPETAGLKADYAPGTVSEPRFDNGRWRVGYGYADGVRRMMWNPPAGYEGDVARVVMYMLTVYRSGLVTFGGPGGAYVSRESYPGINEWALRQLLAWHRSDPVDESERRRNAEFSKWQGNYNPFVEYPALAEYLWGYRCGAEFDCEGADVGGDVSEPRPLKACYYLDEPVIRLYHPAAAEGAVWKINGRVVADGYLDPSVIGTGLHELRFEADGVVGNVMIEIRP